MRLIDHGDHIGEWVAKKNNSIWHSSGSQCIGLVKDGEILAGTWYENWTGRSITTHIAITAINKEYLRVIFDYPFNKCKVEKIIAPVISTNSKSIRFVKHLGFIEECRISNAYPDGDLIMFVMDKKDCRFITKEENHGQTS